MPYSLKTNQKFTPPGGTPDLALPKLAVEVKAPAPRLEPAFLAAWHHCNIATDGPKPEPELEYRFHPFRKWRFDFAWPEQKVAVEMEGGVFIGGAHTRGGHYQSDPIPTDHFTVYGSGTGGDHPHVGEYGEFWPNDWGVADAKHKHLSKLYDAEEVS